MSREEPERNVRHIQPEVLYQEIRQGDPFDRLCRDLRWTAWAITTAVWIGIIWFGLTEGRRLIEWMTWR